MESWQSRRTQCLLFLNILISSGVTAFISSSRTFRLSSTGLSNESIHTSKRNTVLFTPRSRLFATIEESSSTSTSQDPQDPSSSSSALIESIHETKADILSQISQAVKEGQEWANDFELQEERGAAYYALFAGIRSCSSKVMGMSGIPFYLTNEDISEALKDMDDQNGGMNTFSKYFTFDSLAQALEDDFLDATRGSTNNRKGWAVSAVSTPTGSSFEEARMTLEQVQASLEQGTVIFNTAGSHIPSLAGPTLACTDASALPCAVNLYVTKAGLRTSAPPHTDRQDVIVVQTSGQKHWKVYTPPNPKNKPLAEPFARGKGDDALPYYSLEEPAVGCVKLLDVVLSPGDVLFIPAGFPHTTDTVQDVNPEQAETSLHLTFNFDTHVWDLDYLSLRRYALRRAGVIDTALGQGQDTDNRYVGDVNLLSDDLRNDLFKHLPLGLLEDDGHKNTVASVTTELKRISENVDKETYNAVAPSIWEQTVQEVRSSGMQLFDTHRDMYLAAIDEGRTRKAEEAMRAHLTGDALARAKAMTPEKMQRLSLFRVQKFYELIDKAKADLTAWSWEGMAGSARTEDGDSKDGGELPSDWEWSWPLKVGDQVEADLGGAFFPATVTKATETSYDVQFFDGDVMDGLTRSMIKLTTLPSITSGSKNTNDGGSPPPGLTKKEIKQWRRKQEKKKAKKGFA